MMIGNGRMILGNCLDVMADIPDASIDMVLCDLPYGTTACSWDTIIPFEPLWAHYWRVAKPNAAIVLTAAQPFTSALVMSQIDRFKYDWSWDKKGVTGHLNAKKRPLRRHEDILIFANGTPPYFASMTTGRLRSKGGRKDKGNQVYGNAIAGPSIRNDQYYPQSVLEISNAGNKSARFHPTQKPVALFEYLIRTYTNEGDTVLDNCSGSGTTAIAAINSGRRFVCIEQDVEYYYASLNRVREAAA